MFAARSLALTRSVAGRYGWKRRQPLRPKRLTASTSCPETVALGAVQPPTTAASLFTSRLPYFLGGLACGVGLWAFAKSCLLTPSSDAEAVGDAAVPLERLFARSASLVKVDSPRAAVGNSPLTKNLLQQDNLFDKMMEVEMVKEIHNYYDPERKEFHSIVHLGKSDPNPRTREVCGYPNTVHGGLTAAIVDETFGGLMFNIWRSGELGFSLPAVTARLEVDYCNRLPQNSVVVCTTKIEQPRNGGRSFWMQAELCDQTHTTTYATARACFVSPSWKRSALKWIAGILSN